MATLPTPNDLTRQQLDELDALLQRMLSLPLNKSESVKVPPAPPLPVPEMPVPSNRPSVSLWRADAAPTPRSPYIAAEPEPAVAFTPSFAAVAEPVEAIAHSGGPGTLRGVDAPATPYGYKRSFGYHDEESASAAAVPSPYSRYDLADVNPFAESPVSTLPPPRDARSGTPFFAWPVIGVNWLIEAALGWMGPVGAVVRMPTVKHLLGAAGFALLVGAGIWSAKGMGWVTWPK